MTEHISWRVFPLERSLGDHAAAWDALRLRKFGPNPMLSSSFVNCLLQCFGSGDERLCIASEGTDVRGMCILRPCRAFLWRSFLPPQEQIGPTLLDCPDLLPSLFAALPASINQIDLLCNDEHFGDLANKSFINAHSMDHALTMHIELQGSFTDYWNARPKKLVQNIERYRRRCAASGKKERFVSITSADEMRAAITRYAALEQEGWKGQTGTALGSNLNQQRFYEQIMAEFARRGAAHVWELWHDDRLVASRLAIVEGERLVMLKTTYSESDAEFAPGRVLLRLAIEEAFKLLAGGRVEFYTDATEDQLKWASGHRWVRHLSFYRNPLTWHLAAGLRASKRITDSKKFRQQPPRHDVKVYRRVDELPESARQLLDEAQTSDIQFGIDWYRNLIDTVFEHTPEAEVRFYSLEIDGSAVAVLPVLMMRTRIGAQVKALSNYYTSLYAPALRTGLKAQQLVPLIRHLLEDRTRPSVLQFSPMATSAPSFRTLLASLRLANLVCFPYFCFGNWFLPVHFEWKEYLQAREGRLRSTISRMRKRLAADGGHLEIFTTEDIDRGLQAYEAVYAASWKQSEPHKEFTPGLIRLCSANGWLRLGVAWINDKPIAAQIWIVANGKAAIYKVAYDENYKALSPGTLLTAMLVEHTIDIDKVREIDYLIGDDPYKQKWMTQRRERWGIIAYNPRTLGGVLGVAAELMGRLTKRLRLHLSKFYQARANGSAAVH